MVVTADMAAATEVDVDAAMAADTADTEADVVDTAAMAAETTEATEVSHLRGFELMNRKKLFMRLTNK